MPLKPPVADHRTLTADRFGTMAEAYAHSRVHANGADLPAVAAWAEVHRFGTVLDLGAGPGHVTLALAPHVGTVTACDLSAAMLDQLRQSVRDRHLKNVHVEQGDASALPFPSQAFDAVATRFSAHHWQDLPQALSEVVRVLKPGGRFWIMDVAAPEEPLMDTYLQAIEVFRDPTHVRNRSPNAWAQLLSDQGFTLEASRTSRLPLEFTAWIQRMQTPPVRARAIRSLLAAAPKEVQGYFAIQRDASFTVDTVQLEAQWRL